MYEYSDIQTTVIVIFGAIAAFVLLAQAIKAWREMFKPSADTKEKVAEHGRRLHEDDERIEDHERRITHLEGCCAEVQGKLQNDWQFQQDETEMNRLMLKSIKQLIKHSLDGNDTRGLKHMEDEIDTYLLDHAQ